VPGLAAENPPPLIGGIAEGVLWRRLHHIPRARQDLGLELAGTADSPVAKGSLPGTDGRDFGGALSRHGGTLGYRNGDLKGAFLAIASPDVRSINPEIWEEAEEEKVLLNAMDDTAHCHFIAPAIHREGDITVAVSTGGKGGSR
jgi:hypothetical protein